jgi:hypothetical protein
MQETKGCQIFLAEERVLYVFLEVGSGVGAAVRSEVDKSSSRVAV